MKRKEINLSRPQTRARRSRRALNLNMAGQRAGKSQMIGIQTGEFINAYPKLKGFVGANTYLQLIQSTLVKVFEIWDVIYGMTKYDRLANPGGHFVIDRAPPAHFKRYDTFKDYRNIISFWNGHVIYVGSLDNYMAHDGKEFAYAHLDETKDTKEVAVTSVILARLSQQGLFVYDLDEPCTWTDTYQGSRKQQHAIQQDSLVYIPDYQDRQGDIDELCLRPFNPAYIHTSPAIGEVEWLVKMFCLREYEPEIRKRIQGFDEQGRHDFFHKEFDDKCVCIWSTYHNEENLPSNYIAGRKAVLSENEQLKLIYGYPFSKTGGEYFPKFERLKHVTKVPFINGLPLHQSWDFNVVPYMTLICAQTQFVARYMDPNGKKYKEYKDGRTLIDVLQIRIYKEYCLASPQNNVEEVAKAFDEDHRMYQNNGVQYYGDATGRNRIPGLGDLTNFKQVELYMEKYLHNDSQKVRKTNMGQLVRRDFINRILENKYPNVELYIDEGCVELIRDMEYLKLAQGGKLKEKEKDPLTGAWYEKIGHTSDALEYMVCEMLKPYITEIPQS